MRSAAAACHRVRAGCGTFAGRPGSEPDACLDRQAPLALRAEPKAQIVTLAADDRSMLSFVTDGR